MDNEIVASFVVSEHSSVIAYIEVTLKKQGHEQLKTVIIRTGVSYFVEAFAISLVAIVH